MPNKGKFLLTHQENLFFNLAESVFYPPKHPSLISFILSFLLTRFHASCAPPPPKMEINSKLPLSALEFPHPIHPSLWGP